MSWSSLTTLMNERVFADVEQITDVTVGPGEEDDEPGTIEIDGTLTSVPPRAGARHAPAADTGRVERMNEQHRAGYIKLQRDGGLVVHAPDLDDLER